MAELLLIADELPQGSPFNEYTKLQWIISKGRTPENISWTLRAMLLCVIFELETFTGFLGRRVCALRLDGYINNTLPPEYFTVRALKGESFPKGTIDMLVHVLLLKQHLLTTVAGLLAWHFDFCL